LAKTIAVNEFSVTPLTESRTNVQIW